MLHSLLLLAELLLSKLNQNHCLNWDFLHFVAVVPINSHSTIGQFSDGKPFIDWVPKQQVLTHISIPKCQRGNLTWMGQLCFRLEKKLCANIFVLKNTHNNRALKIVFYWKVRVSIWHAFEEMIWFSLTISLTLTHIVFCKFERNKSSTQAIVCFWCQIWYN